VKIVPRPTVADGAKAPTNVFLETLLALVALQLIVLSGFTNLASALSALVIKHAPHAPTTHFVVGVLTTINAANLMTTDLYKAHVTI